MVCPFGPRPAPSLPLGLQSTRSACKNAERTRQGRVRWQRVLTLADKIQTVVGSRPLSGWFATHLLESSRMLQRMRMPSAAVAKEQWFGHLQNVGAMQYVRPLRAELHDHPPVRSTAFRRVASRTRTLESDATLLARFRRSWQSIAARRVRCWGRRLAFSGVEEAAELLSKRKTLLAGKTGRLATASVGPFSPSD